MIRSILVGLDGSADSEAAVELAIRWGKQLDTLLVGIGVIDESSICRPESAPIGGGAFKPDRDAGVLHQARQRVEQTLQQFAVRCANEQVSCKLLEDTGLPWEQILLEAERYDLIMLGQETHFQFDAQTRGDETLVRVLKQSPRPLVCVPRPLASGNTILVAYDGSVQAARVLQLFAYSGLANQHEIHVVSAAQEHLKAARCADRAVEYLGMHGIHAKATALRSNVSPASLVLDQASKLNAGLLVMGAYGRATVKELFLGTTTRNILRNSQTPIFLYH